MSEYHKIQTVYKRDPATKHKTLLEGEWSLPEFGYLASNEWTWTEKVDGTNVRVMVDDKGWVTFGGRTDNAQIPTFLVARLQERFSDNPALSELAGATLYGEGYGAKIQKGGGDYIRDGCDFILFDVRFGSVWLERPNVEDIAATIGCPVVPIVRTGTLYDAVEYARAGIPSVLRETLSEGLVMRPLVELRTRRGERIITKIKCRDFA